MVRPSQRALGLVLERSLTEKGPLCCAFSSPFAIEHISYSTVPSPPTISGICPLSIPPRVSSILHECGFESDLYILFTSTLYRLNAEL